MTRDRSGQTLTEFAFVSLLLAALIAQTAWVFQAHWERARCVWRVFESTRQQAEGEADEGPLELDNVMDDAPSLWRGSRTCNANGAVERVSIPRLSHLWKTRGHVN